MWNRELLGNGAMGTLCDYDLATPTKPPELGGCRGFEDVGHRNMLKTSPPLDLSRGALRS